MSKTLGANLEAFRRHGGYTQSQVAEQIGVSRPTYAQIESGEKDITLGQADTLAKLFGVRVEDLTTSSALRSSRLPDKEEFEKYKQIILNAVFYGADSSDGKMTKTKLAKIVYLADFSWFYNHKEPLSSLFVAYRRLPRGPVADIYFRAIDEMVDDGVLNLEPSGRAFMLSMVESGNAPSSRLTVKQRSFIRAISEAWKDKQTQEIVDFTHQQNPWLTFDEYAEIPYESILVDSKDKVYGPAKLANL